VAQKEAITNAGDGDPNAGSVEINVENDGGGESHHVKHANHRASSYAAATVHAQPKQKRTAPNCAIYAVLRAITEEGEVVSQALPAPECSVIVLSHQIAR
jgi:hypothetical protein